LNITGRLTDWMAHLRRCDLKGQVVQIITLLLFCALTAALVVYHVELPGKWGYLAVMGLAGLFGLLIIGNLNRVLLAAILIDIPLRWDIYLGARVANPPLGMREGWIIAATTLALVMLYGIYLLQELVHPRSQPRLLLWSNLPLTLYMVIACLSVFVARDTRGALFQVFFLMQMYLLYLYIASTIRTAQDIYFLVFFLLVGLAFEGLVVLAQRFAGLQVNWMGIVTVNTYGRMAGTLGSPNVAAGYFSLLLAPALSLSFTRLPQLARAGGLLAFGLGGLGLVFTVSRGGWIAFTLSLGIFAVAAWLRGRLPGWLMFCLLSAGILGAAFLGEPIYERLTGMRTNAAMARIPLMQIAFRMIEDHPLLGVGANNYAINIRRYLTPEISRSFLYVVHNKYLLVWAETGLGGILAFVSFLGLALWRGWQCWRRNDHLLSALALAFVAAIAGQMTHMMVEIFDSRSQIQLLWLVAAMLSAMERITRGGKDDAS